MKIIATAPTRISFFGGGSDLPEFAQSHGGAVISMAINLRQHVTLLTDDDSWRLTTHKIPAGADPSLCYKVLEHYGLNGQHSGVRVKSSYDGVIGAGLGSSGAFAVALVAALEKYKGFSFSRMEIARRAYQIEVLALEKTGGSQDHFAASHGGMNYFQFQQEVSVLPLMREWVEKIYPSMVLFYTGKTRRSENIQEELIGLTPRKIKLLTKLKNLVPFSIPLFAHGDIKDIGELLNFAWHLKKDVNPLATDRKLDAIYDYAIEVGACGGKLLGAGGGGHFLFLIAPFARQRFVDNMYKKFRIEEVNFMPDYGGVEVRRV